MGDWKLIEFFEDGRRELYNLRDDVGEKNNLAAAQPERANDLHAKLAAWRKQIGAPMPTINTNRQASTEKARAKQRHNRAQND